MNRLYGTLVAALVVTFNFAAGAACPTGTTARPGQTIEGKPVCAIAGSYLNTTITLNSANAYVLEGDVRIGGDNKQTSVLSLQPGTKVYGASGSFLVIMRGSKIMATGTAGNPVVFTSLQRDNLKPGLWGGIVINGNAPINNCKAGEPICEGLSEGIKNDTPKFGGNNASDNSGVLKYVRVEYAGFELAKDNELNGITFNGVGSDTEVDYVQVYRNADDGVEFFGGTVNVRHLVLTDNDDDGLDWDMGWSGKAQFVVIELENGTEDSNGIEADNLKSPMNAEPRSNPTLSNLTIIARSENPKLFNGVLLRRGTAGQIHNAIVTGDFKVACINIDDEETFRNGGVVAAGGVAQTGLKMMNSIVNCTNGKNFDDKDGDLFKVSEWFQSQGLAHNQMVDPKLNRERRPDSSSPAVGKGVVPRVTGKWQFTAVDFIGALSPFADEDWTRGWSVR